MAASSGYNGPPTPRGTATPPITAEPRTPPGTPPAAIDVDMPPQDSSSRIVCVHLVNEIIKTQ